MRVVLDYGGVVVNHVDEREYAHLLGVSPDEDPYPGWLAYYLFRAGFLDTHAQYISLLSTLTGASEDACEEYVEETWLSPEFPESHVRVLERTADDHSIVTLSNMVKPWMETVLRRRRVLELFDALYVSSELERPKPHPRGYVRSIEDTNEDAVMVSDEFNEDLLMAQHFGVTTVWLENEDDEEPYDRPDHTVQAFEDVPGVLDEIAAE
ncbi:HAD family hydrolase [Salarchaeum sp. III]|uniref:HAD family hydrolase n=1 Tax=Salarchaeum sp. III TaxID=3107927 RepID=UPI002ED95EB9